MESFNSTRREMLKFGGIGLATSITALPSLAAAKPSGTSRAADVFDIRTYGAVGDGKTVDTPSINKAIEAAAAAGGGTVLFPAGNYLCYSIRLKSNIALYLDAGATIIAADTPEGVAGGYDAAEPNTPWDKYEDFGHSHFHNSLIWGEGIENI